MCAVSTDFSIIHNNDMICILNRRNTLCNDDLGGIRNLLQKSLTDQCICLGIYRTGRVIQDQNLRFLQ